MYFVYIYDYIYSSYVHNSWLTHKNTRHSQGTNGVFLPQQIIKGIFGNPVFCHNLLLVKCRFQRFFTNLFFLLQRKPFSWRHLIAFIDTNHSSKVFFSVSVGACFANWLMDSLGNVVNNQPYHCVNHNALVYSTAVRQRREALKKLALFYVCARSRVQRLRLPPTYYIQFSSNWWKFSNYILYYTVDTENFRPLYWSFSEAENWPTAGKMGQYYLITEPSAAKRTVYWIKPLFLEEGKLEFDCTYKYCARSMTQRHAFK